MDGMSERRGKGDGEGEGEGEGERGRGRGREEVGEREMGVYILSFQPCKLHLHVSLRETVS